MEVTESLYSWLNQYGLVKHPLQIHKSRVFLHEEDSLRMTSGHAINQLLKRFFPNIPQVSLKEGDSSSIRSANWAALSRALEKANVGFSMSQKSSILGGNSSSILELLLKFKQLEAPSMKEGALVLDEVDLSKDLGTSASPLEFLILSICAAFNFTPKQVVGLLAQNAKLLGQLLIRGLKGDFEPVLNWLTSVHSHIETLSSLVEDSDESLAMVLDTLKYGISSKDPDVAVFTLVALTDLHATVRYKKQVFWDWFGRSELQKLCLAIYTQKNASAVVRLLFEFGKKNLEQVFCSNMVDILGPQCFDRLIYIVKELEQLPQAVILVENSGVVSFWVNKCLKEYGYDFNRVANSKVNSLMLLCSLWEAFPKYFSLYNDQFEALLSAIKKGFKNKSDRFKCLLIGKLFQVCSLFAQQRSSFLPILLKLLTFHMAELFSNDQLRGYFSGNFIVILGEGFVSPTSVLEPLLKSYHSLNRLNTFDFELILKCVTHEEIELKPALSALEIMGKVYMADPLLARAAMIPMLAAIERFADTVQIRQFVHKMLKSGYKLLSSKSRSKGDPHRMESLFHYFTDRVVSIGNHALRQQVQEMRAFSHNHKKKNTEPTETRPKVKSGSITSQSDVRHNVFSLAVVPKGRAMQDIQKAYLKRKEMEEKQRSISEQRNLHQTKQKEILKKQVEHRRIALGVGSRLQNEDTAIVRGGFALKKYELFNIHDENEDDQQLLYIVLEKYSKATKLLFKKYAYSRHSQDIAYKDSFENPRIKKEQIKEGEMIRLLRDNRVEKSMISTELIKEIWTLVTRKNDPPIMNYELFMFFLYQIALCIFRRGSSQDLSIYPSAISLKALYEIFSTSGIIPKHMYDLPNIGSGDPQVIKTLNAQLLKNPSMPVPTGYKKVKDYIIGVSYKLPPQVETTRSIRISLSILDEILQESLGLHLLLPIIQVQEITRAKGVLNKPVAHTPEPTMGVPSHTAMYKWLPFPSYMNFSAQIKVEVSNLADQFSQSSLLEVARLVDDLMHSVSEGSSTVISRNPKPPKLIKNKFTREQEIARFSEQKLRAIEEEKRKRRAEEVLEKVKTIHQVKEQKFKEEQDQKRKEKEKEIEKARAANVKVQELSQKMTRAFNKQILRSMKTPELKQNFSHQHSSHRDREEYKKVKRRLREQIKSIELSRSKQKIDEERRIAESLEYKKKQDTYLKKQLKANKQEELIDRAAKDYFQKAWRDQAVQQSFRIYHNSLKFLFEHYAKLNDPLGNILNYTNLVKFLNQFNVFPNLVNSEVLNRVFKALTKNNEVVGLTLENFKELLLRISILCKDKVEDDLDDTFPNLNEQLLGFFEWMILPLDETRMRDFIKIIETAVFPLHAKDRTQLKKLITKKLIHN